MMIEIAVLALLACTSHVAAEHHAPRALLGTVARQLQQVDDLDLPDEIPGVSTECIEEANEFYNNFPEVVQAADKLENEANQVLDACDESSFEATCVVDYDELPSIGEYNDACSAAGGTIYKITAVLSCSGTILGQDFDVTAGSKNLPICIPQVCDADLDQVVAFMDYLASSFVEAISELTNELPQDENNKITCTADVSETDSNGVSVKELQARENGGNTSSAAGKLSSILFAAFGALGATSMYMAI